LYRVNGVLEILPHLKRVATLPYDVLLIIITLFQIAASFLTLIIHKVVRSRKDTFLCETASFDVLCVKNPWGVLAVGEGKYPKK